MRHQNCVVTLGALLLAALLAGCGTTAYVPHEGSCLHFSSISRGKIAGVAWPIPAEVLAFNPGIDPLHLQDGDAVYLPSKNEIQRWREIGDRMWLRPGEYLGDHDGDGNVELIRVHLLAGSSGRDTYEVRPDWVSFLSLFDRDADGEWRRHHTLLWTGAEIQQIQFLPAENCRLAQVTLRSGGATAMGTYSFVVIDTDSASPNVLRKLVFRNGFLEGKSQFTTTGSAGYGLRFELSEDWHTIVFYKYETSPIPVVSRAEYRLERTDSGRVGGYVLVKEERVQKYATIEDAAIDAWEFNVGDPSMASEEWYTGPRDSLFDRTATVELWRSHPELLEMEKPDLDGDGVEETLLYNGKFIDSAGEQTHSDGGMGANRSWAVLQKTSGGWRVVGAGWGRWPQAQKQTTAGWRDLLGGYHLSAAQGAEYLYQFDGTRYRRTRNVEYDHSAPEAKPTSLTSAELNK